MSTTATATAGSSSVRQSTRQTRTNPSRTSKAAGRSSAAQNTQAIIGGSNNITGGAGEHAQVSNTPHGFYPAITHFTDAILALPREVRRHTSLLKEVDAKAWALEENLQALLHTASGSQPIKNGSQLASGASDGSFVVSRDQQGQSSESQENTARRRLFYDLRCTLSEIMFTSDEKNHVLVNASDELQRQLGRLDAVYPYVEGEVSDEARLGSTTHWAYSSEDPKNKKKNNGTSGNERTRREVAAANHGQDADAASRSETRRQAVNTRKNKRTHADLDFEDGRPTTTTTGRKTAAGKNQRSTDTPDRSANSTANTATATPAPAKRRKVEKQPQTQTGTTAESNPNNAANPSEAKDASAPDPAPKKRTRAPPNPAGRKRNNTVTSNTGSASAISSPVIGTFNAPRNAASPAPSTSNRPQSSRTQNTAQSQNGRQKPQSSASNRGNANTRTLPVHSRPNPEVSNTSPTTEKSTPTELHKSTLKEAASAKTESITVSAEVKDSDVHADSVTAPPADIPPKREETPNVASNTPTTSTVTGPAPITTVERQPSVPKGRSKTSTPVTSTFSESSAQQQQPQRSRSTRATEAPAAKRSHKKGAGQAMAAAQQQAAIPVTATTSAALALEDDESSRLEDDEEDDESEPRYCYCNQVSFGEMVACDNDTCPREWFHLSCVGLTKPPLKSAKWYCNECKDNQKRGNRGNGR